MEVCPGIHQVPGLRWSNSYLLVEPERLTLIDAGPPGAGKKIIAYIERIGRSPEELERVVLTHSHPDHTGPVKELAQGTGAAVTVHPSDTRCRGKGHSRWLHYPGQPPAWDWKVPFLHRIPAHELLEDGQDLPVMGGLKVFHTPGHTPGSVCFYLAGQGVLFTGDTLIADGHCFRRPGVFPGTSFRDYRASLDRLAKLPFETACTGHGRPLYQGGNRKLREMLDNYFWMTPRWDQMKRWSRSMLRR